MNRKISRYGWLRDHLDSRDRKFSVGEPIALPASVDLRTSGFMPPVYDQLQVGSCTANAISAAIDHERKKQGEAWLTPSRLFIYFNERSMEGTVASDSGAEIRDGIKSVASQGVCPESEWAYIDDGKQFAATPTPTCYTDAVKVEALQYASVPQDAVSIKTVLAQGRPVVFGISVYDAFESDEVAKTGLVPMPGPNDAPIGGHAICIVGFDDAKSLFTFRNSWGDWADAGYGFLPYAYVLDSSLASDFWVISLES